MPRNPAFLAIASALLLTQVLSSATALAEESPSRSLASVPSPGRVGEGRYSFAFWDVYDITLYAPGGVWRPDKPYALALRYLTDIKGKDIADRSVQEIRKQGFADEVKLAVWNAQMKNIFPDVTKGTTLTGVFTPGEQTVFFRDDQPIGSVRGDEFGRLFFGIWLSEKTSEPELRRKLLGTTP